MKNIVIYLSISLFITGCASTNDIDSVLFAKYSQYKESVNKDNLNEIADEYFALSLLGKNYQNNPEAQYQLLFKSYMASIDSHYEILNSQTGCLNINGFDEEKSPLIFSLQYTFSNEDWLISEIHVAFIESKNNFATKAKCPAEYALN